MKHRLLLLAGCCVAAPLLVARADDFQGSQHKVPYDEEIIDYSRRASDSPIDRLQRRIDRGEVTLAFDPKLGWLPALLQELNIPKSSQVMVFSKTSLQRQYITPSNPRAIYFNDEVYLGFIPGAPVMEVSAVDKRLGGVFYTLALDPEARPKFVRSDDCTSCHASGKTMGVPGHFVRSIGTDESGELDAQSEISGITHRSPLVDRWAGWYVTGTHGDQAHRGNLIGAKDFARFEQEPLFRGNLTRLEPFYDTGKYAAPTSDIVALMVLEHQGHMHNYITRLNFETQIMMKTYGHIRYLRTQVAGFLRYLLFTEEQPLTAPVRGDPEYVKWFEAQGPRDSRGRSLRDLDFNTRMFKYPLSYLIYSEAFDGIPDVMREHLYQRLHDILTGKDTSEDFARLTAADRRAILEILVETKKGLPDYYRASLAALVASDGP